jgi:hypothetical protein
LATYFHWWCNHIFVSKKYSSWTNNTSKKLWDRNPPMARCTRYNIFMR